MSNIPSLISDLAVILTLAGIVTILFKWLKQPVVLGYIVAGILAGPSISIVPTVTTSESIQTWADIGVIFLLFALGLEFSFKKLIQKYTVVTCMKWMFTYATIVVLPFTYKELSMLPWASISIATWLETAFVVSVATGLGVFGWSQGLAVVLVFGGVWLVTQSKSRADMKAEAQRQTASKD